MIKITIAMLLTLGLTGCAGMLPDVANIVHEVEDKAIVIEVNREAIKQDTDIHITCDVLQKDPPRPKPKPQ